MIKPLIPLFVSALMALTPNNAESGPEQGQNSPESLQTCPSGQGMTVVKTAGSCSGTSCPMACKRTVCAPNKWWARKTQLNPLCNPVTGANCDYQVVWRYEVKTTVTATNACPADINNAAYAAP